MSKRVRDYRQEYDDYHSRPEQKKNRAQRNAARDIMEKKGAVRKGDGKEVDHHNTPIRHGGSNAPSNLKVSSAKANRGWKGKT